MVHEEDAFLYGEKASYQGLGKDEDDDDLIEIVVGADEDYDDSWRL